MGLFSFLKSLWVDKIYDSTFDSNEYVPGFWEDDYCQIEIVPVENKSFILEQTKQIDDFTQRTRTDYGFTDAFEVESMPISTFSKELRADYFENTLLSFQFERARHIRYEQSKIFDTDTGITKAFGFSNFTIFFETEDEFVKNIWVHIGLIVSVTQFDLIEKALYTIGEECGLVLIDWNRLEFFDLADKIEVTKYLMEYWK